MKILLWGAYQQGNFGDDLMAWVFARGIKELGHSVKVFGLSPSEAEDFGLETATSIDEALEEADAVVLGGGAVYEKWWSIKDIGRTALIPQVRAFELMYLQLGLALRRHQKPIHFLSVGSDGIEKTSQLSPFRRLVLASKQVGLVTLRLKHDLQLDFARGANYRHVPDVLFATPRLITEVPKANTHPKASPDTIVLNLHKKHTDRIPALMSAIRSNWPNANIFSMASHLPEAGLSYEWSPNASDPIEPLPYTGARSALNILASADLVISSKLHVGIVGMAYGSGFLSLGGRSKVKLQLNEMDKLETCYVDPEQFSKLKLEEVLSSAASQSATSIERMSRLSDNASSHFDMLAGELNGI